MGVETIITCDKCANVIDVSGQFNNIELRNDTESEYNTTTARKMGVYCFECGPTLWDALLEVFEGHGLGYN